MHPPWGQCLKMFLNSMAWHKQFLGLTTVVTVSLIIFQASSPRWSFKHVSSILAALPHTLITDNGPQFTSELFKGFARKYEFYHIPSKLGPNSLTSTSLFPRAQSRTVGHGGHRELKMWPQNPLSKWREDFPRRGRGQIVLFCYTNTKICIHGPAQSAVIAKMVFAEKSLKTTAFWRYQTLSGFVCLIPGNKQLFVEVL